MSKQRMIDTKFWDDNYTSNLDPIEKLMFLYFLTNTSTNISGIYEIPLKKIAVETGIEKEMVAKILTRFEKDNKVFYFNGWLCLKNFVKNQNQNSPKVQIGIKNELSLIPRDIMEKFIGYGYPIAFNLIKSNLIKEETPLPNWLNKEAWGEWVAYRKERGKKLTPMSIKKQLKDLEKNKADQVEIINNSIRNGWTGLFALKKTAPHLLKYNPIAEREAKRKIYEGIDEDKIRELDEKSRDIAKKFKI